MTFNPTVEQIKIAMGSNLENVRANYPLLHEALVARGVKYDSGFIAALATIACETRSFLPIHEIGGNAYFFRMYDRETKDPKRADVWKALGNTVPGDGIKYHGRGYIQLTGRANYTEMGKKFGIDLVNNPDLALDPKYAALIFAEFFVTHGCDVWAQRAVNAKATSCKHCVTPRKHLKLLDEACSKCCWMMVRKKVNGGITHFEEVFYPVAKKLSAFVK